jgi:protein-tyrosine phosphatase
MIDLHCHLLPGVDDGAANLAETRAAIERMREEGVEGAVVTPHLNASTLLRPEAAEEARRELDDAWDALRDMCDRRYPDFVVLRGAELMLDRPNPDLSFEWVRLGGTRFALIEFPGMMIPPRSSEALSALVRSGYSPVLAHPERYSNASATGSEVAAWRDAGVRIQVNCGSLLGLYGEAAARRAQSLLHAGMIDYLASDYHARGRLTIAECRRSLEEDGCAEQAELLMCTNPARLIEDKDPLEASPCEPRVTGWRKLVKRGLFGRS